MKYPWYKQDGSNSLGKGHNQQIMKYNTATYVSQNDVIKLC